MTKLKNFSLLHDAKYNYIKFQDSTYDPIKLAILSNLRPEAELISICGHIFKKTVSVDEVVHLIDEENIVT